MTYDKTCLLIKLQSANQLVETLSLKAPLCHFVLICSPKLTHLLTMSQQFFRRLSFSPCRDKWVNKLPSWQKKLKWLNVFVRYHNQHSFHGNLPLGIEKDHMMAWIHSTNRLTRTETEKVGPPWHQWSPQLIIPLTNHRPFSSQVNGPPLSPWQPLIFWNNKLTVCCVTFPRKKKQF